LNHSFYAGGSFPILF